MAWLTGYPREKVNWYPTIDPDKCLKCGMCMNCGKNVYEWTDKGSRVANPLECVVGCTTCTNLCLGKAISHPSVEELRLLYQKENIWSKVKNQMKEQGKLVLVEETEKYKEKNNG